jgi:hypothetical protein
MTVPVRAGSHGGYQAYLVRLWQDSPDAPWRALTRDAETGDEQRFATLEQLYVFLHRRTHGTRTGGRVHGEADEPQPP